MNLLGGSVLGDSLSTLGDSVLGELTREEESAGSLNLSGGDCGLLVDLGKAGSFAADSVEDVAHERVHDGHGLGGDSLVGVDLLEDLVDVDAERLLSCFVVLAGSGSGHFSYFRLFKFRVKNEDDNSSLYTICWEGIGQQF